MSLDLDTAFDDLDPDEADLFDQGDDYDWYEPADWGDYDPFEYDPFEYAHFDDDGDE